MSRLCYLRWVPLGEFLKFESFSQLIATVLAASFHIVVGIALAFSGILLPQLEDENFPISPYQRPWIGESVPSASPGY
jgi:hypothetical protein